LILAPLVKVVKLKESNALPAGGKKARPDLHESHKPIEKGSMVVSTALVPPEAYVGRYRYFGKG